MTQPCDRSRDRGAVSVMVALMFVGLLAVGALIVDVGAFYVEGRQLQNGAENAALAVARTCAGGNCNATAGNGIANANSGDGQAQAETVCGTAPGLSSCASSGERARFGCRPVSGSAPYVQVQTRSVPAVPPMLSSLLDDNDGGADDQGTRVRACARAAYGAPAGLQSELPLALSQCEWDWWTNRYMTLFGTKYVSAPYPAGSEAILYFHNTGDLGPSTCPNSSPSNANPQLPGGFGWLQTGSQCTVITDSAGDAYEKPGNSPPGSCSPGDFQAMLDKIVHVPVFGSITNSTGKYDIVGYAGFHLTGYRLGGGPEWTRASPTLGTSPNPCASSARCITGHFVQDPVPATSGPLLPGPGFGVTAIQAVG